MARASKKVDVVEESVGGGEQEGAVAAAVEAVEGDVVYSEFFYNVAQGCAEVIENLLVGHPRMRQLAEMAAYDLHRLARACEDEGI